MATSPARNVKKIEFPMRSHFKIPKIQKRFNKLQNEIDRVEDDMIRGYVLKQDFIREMDTVHQKLDRILELMIKQNSK